MLTIGFLSTFKSFMLTGWKFQISNFPVSRLVIILPDYLDVLLMKFIGRNSCLPFSFLC